MCVWREVWTHCPPSGFAHGVKILFYQSPLKLTELFQHNLINVSYLRACYLYQVMMTLHFLNDVAYDALSTQKSKKYVIIASLKSVQQWVN